MDTNKNKKGFITGMPRLLRSVKGSPSGRNKGSSTEAWIPNER